QRVRRGRPDAGDKANQVGVGQTGRVHGDVAGVGRVNRLAEVGGHVGRARQERHREVARPLNLETVEGERVVVLVLGRVDADELESRRVVQVVPGAVGTFADQLA